MREVIARVKAGVRLHQLTQDLKAQNDRLETQLTEAAAHVTSQPPKDIPEDARSCVSIASRFISFHELGGDIYISSIPMPADTRYDKTCFLPNLLVDSVFYLRLKREPELIRTRCAIEESL